ncbi:MAG: Metallophosphoesterase, partial [candidate division WS6 bacterium GW2011_GWA2_37_6]
MASSKVTKLLFLGDISTRYGRQIVRDVLPSIKKKDGVDIVVANCENAAGGRGVTREIVNELQACGIDYFTTGEHVWDVARFRNDLVDENVPLLRPYNYEGMGEIPGKGWTVLDMGANGQIIIINLIGQVFMRDHVRSPFWAFDELYRKLEEDLGQEFLQKTPIIIDLHAETTAEKIA